MDERTSEFTNVIKKINAEARNLRYKHGLDWAENAGVLGASDAGSYEGAHYLRNAVAHGRAMDVRVTQETLDFVNAILLTIQATKQASNASKFHISFIQNLFGKKEDDLPEAQEKLDVDDRTQKFLNVIELINAEAGGLGYTNGRDWAEKAGVLGAGDVSNYVSCHYLRLATMHGRAKDVHVTQETLDFAQAILQAIQEAGQTADTSKPRTSYYRELFNKKKADRPAAEPAEVPHKPEPKPDTLEWYLQNAEKGDASAQFELGRRYANGDGVAEDKAEAMKWYRMAALLGYAESQFILGTWYDENFDEYNGVPKDREKAKEWYLKAAEQGHAKAQFQLAELLHYSKEYRFHEDETAAWYRKAAEQGLPEAQYAYAKFDRANEYKWLQEASAQGYGEASFSLAFNYTREPGMEAEVLKWSLKAAEQGDSRAAGLVGQYYNKLGFKKEALKWCIQAQEGGRYWILSLIEELSAELGKEAELTEWYLKMVNSSTKYVYALCRWYEKCGNKAEAMKWYLKAAEQGHAQAQIDLAQLHSEGDLYDEKQSQKWLMKAAEQGDRTALDLRADYETDEDALDGDDTLEERYIAEARAGAPGTMYELGYNYLYGCGGLRKNPEKAVQWLTWAAERGDGDAMYELGCCYENGWGVDQDEDVARQWYWEAFVQGSDEAEIRLKELREEEED